MRHLSRLTRLNPIYVKNENQKRLVPQSTRCVCRHVEPPYEEGRSTGSDGRM